MISVTKPLISGKTMQTFLDSFHLTDKTVCFEKALKSVFIKGTDKNMTTFIMGCKKDIALTYATTKMTDYFKVEMSSQFLEISNIKDINGGTVFTSNEKIYGWFIFIDENTFANWGHACKYIFYVNKDIFFEEHQLLPHNIGFPMEVVG